MLLYWYLNDREPLLWVFLVPDTVNITCTMLADYFIPMLFYIAEGFDKRFVEVFVWTDMLHTESLRYDWQTLELDDGAVFTHFLHLFAILDVNVRRGVFLVVFDGEAISRRWTLASEPMHLRGDFLHAHGTDGGEVRDDFTMTCHDDFGQ